MNPRSKYDYSIYDKRYADKVGRDEMRRREKAYYDKHRDKVLARRRAYRSRPDRKAYDERYAAVNNEKINLRRRTRQKTRWKTDANYRLRILLSTQIHQSIRTGKTCSNTSLLGCSISNFRIYIESKFEPGMTWQNIHLDHIVPKSLFDLTKPEHQKACFHFSNYQPLLAIDNLRKKNKFGGNSPFSECNRGGCTGVSACLVNVANNKIEVHTS